MPDSRYLSLVSLPNNLVMTRPSLIPPLLFTALATLLVYGRVVTFDFVDFDDYQYVTRNPAIQSGFTWDSVRWAFTSFYASNWHPLTWLSHLLDIELFGLKPGGHHLVNLMLHLGNALLLLAILARMTGAVGRSFCVAILFAIHPLHVESVAYVAERKDVLSALFWFLTMGAYLSYVKTRSKRRYALVLGLFALGLIAKPMLVTLPFVLLLLDHWPLRRCSPRSLSREEPGSHSLLSLCLEKVPLLILAAASSLVTYLAQERGGSVSHIDPESFPVQLGNVMISYVTYLEKTFWPAKLAVFYPFDPHAVTWARVGLSALVLSVISWCILRQWRRRPYLSVGWLWFLGTLVPVVGFVQVGGQSLADRYTYIPLVGLFLVIVWGGEELADRWQLRRNTRTAVILVVVLALSVTTWFQIGHWRNSITLFQHAAEVTSDNWLAHHNLGTAYIDQHRYDEALSQLHEALRIKPDYASASNNIGNVYANLGNAAAAIEAYRQALAIDPNHVAARRNLVRTYLRWGYGELAEREYRILKDIDPEEAAKVWPH